MSSHVYFFATNGLIKIGYSSNVRHRLLSHRLRHPDMEVLGAVEGDLLTEKRFHVQFSADHVKGEFFKDTPAIRDAIRAVAKDLPAMKAPYKPRKIWPVEPLPKPAWMLEEEARKRKMDEFYAPLNAAREWATATTAGIDLPPISVKDIMEGRNALQVSYLWVSIENSDREASVDPTHAERLASQTDQFRLLVDNLVACARHQSILDARSSDVRT